jgi:glutathionylspermidine synthase
MSAIAVPKLSHHAAPLRAGAALDAEAFHAIRRAMVLEHCKWDPQVGDVSTLAPFPLILSAVAWRELERLTSQLAMETLAAERELLERPELHDDLGLPRAVRRALRFNKPPTPAASRIMRFDFHPTLDGWRISEVNSDVPGGFTEASSLTALLAEHAPGVRAPGDPAETWVSAIARAADRGRVGLLSATGYMEDTQIVAYIGRRLAQRGCEAVLMTPDQTRWLDGVAHVHGDPRPLAAVVRFFQGEWLVGLSRATAWQHFFRGGRTPVTNPGTALLTESKRLPLVWDGLRTPLPTWRELLPTTRDPRDAPWRTDGAWVLKSALSNNGDAVAHPSWSDPAAWRSARRGARWRPRDWVAQRRFDTLELDTPIGLARPCLGVYAIDGRVAGIYGRLATKAIVDYAAIDVAVLIDASQGGDA